MYEPRLWSPSRGEPSLRVPTQNVPHPLQWKALCALIARQLVSTSLRLPMLFWALKMGCFQGPLRGPGSSLEGPGPCIGGVVSLRVPKRRAQNVCLLRQEADFARLSQAFGAQKVTFEDGPGGPELWTRPRSPSSRVGGELVF